MTKMYNKLKGNTKIKNQVEAPKKAKRGVLIKTWSLNTRKELSFFKTPLCCTVREARKGTFIIG